LIVQSTEQLAPRTGDAIGGLLNASFGNAPEMIIALVALRAGYFDMLRASIIGAILANLMLAVGVAFLLGALRCHAQEYSAGAAPGTRQDAGERGSTGRAIASRVGASPLAARMSESLVRAAEGPGQALGISETSIAIVFLPIIGRAAESGSAVAMARKNKLDL